MRLFYRKYGNGPPLIILHGLLGSSDNWVTIARAISNRLTVILPDQRNHGLSPHSDVHDYESMSNDIKELADDLKLDRFILAGHSMGGKTAVSFACKWPERLNGLLIADISPFKTESQTSETDRHLSILRVVLSIDPAGITSRGEAESILSGRIADERTRGLILKNLVRNSDNSFSWKINAFSLLHNFNKIIEAIVPENITGNPITGFPVIFLKGEKSEYLPEKDFFEILNIFPAAEFITIPSAGHWLHVDNPEAVKKCLLGFSGTG